MPRYRVYRIKHTPGESFRWAAHTGGLAVVKPKDYDPGLEINAATPYAAWKQLTQEGEALRAGDLLEELQSNGEAIRLHIAKYIGFEPAQWYVPEPKPENNVDPLSSTEAVDSVLASNPLQ
jgi:hypothetical protein